MFSIPMKQTKKTEIQIVVKNGKSSQGFASEVT